MTTTHTPGPWEITGRYGPLKCEIGNLSLGEVATVWDRHHASVNDSTPIPCKEGEANAHLIAAAPELLEALQNVADRWDRLDEADAPALGAQIRAAIAKAEGRL